MGKIYCIINENPALRERIKNHIIEWSIQYNLIKFEEKKENEQFSLYNKNYIMTVNKEYYNNYKKIYDKDIIPIYINYTSHINDSQYNIVDENNDLLMTYDFSNMEEGINDILQTEFGFYQRYKLNVEDENTDKNVDKSNARKNFRNDIIEENLSFMDKDNFFIKMKNQLLLDYSNSNYYINKLLKIFITLSMVILSVTYCHGIYNKITISIIIITLFVVTWLLSGRKRLYVIPTLITKKSKLWICCISITYIFLLVNIGIFYISYNKVIINDLSIQDTFSIGYFISGHYDFILLSFIIIIIFAIYGFYYLTIYFFPIIIFTTGTLIWIGMVFYSIRDLDPYHPSFQSILIVVKKENIYIFIITIIMTIFMSLYIIYLIRKNKKQDKQ